MVRAGRLRERVTLQKNTPGAANAANERADVWSNVTTRWARIVPLGGRELFTAQQVYAEASHRIEMRRYDEVTPARMRVTYGSRVFDIEQVIHDERSKETHLICSETVQTLAEITA
ncbi:MAG: phage head closure protein [Acidobacteriota bacterium]|nr:phage head closure protein [Acidobacteriota bacterium]